MKSFRKTQFAKKSFGQNFLVDENYIEKIIDAVAPQKDEAVMEIGAGRGALTEKLVVTGAKIFAVEFEREMIQVLKNKFCRDENFHLIEADALKINFKDFIPTTERLQKIKLVANLPYNISTAILQNLIEQREVFGEMILMFQREVVERIIAGVNSSERGFLSVLSQNYLETKKLFDVPPNAFRPIPKVWSSVVLLKPKMEKFENDVLFRKIISQGFAQRRKTIFNNLKLIFADPQSVLEKSGIELKRRAESITVEEWKRIHHYALEIEQ